MNEDYEALIKQGRKIIERNKYYINHMPSKYTYLKKALEHTGIRKLLLKIFSFIHNRDFFLYEQEFTAFLSASTISKLRGEITRSVSNRYVNYLCCIGFINKKRQHLELDYDLDDKANKMLSSISRNYQKEYYGSIPPNHFYFRSYYENDFRELDRLEDRAQRLIENGITPGNISKVRLLKNNCSDIAEEVYPENDPRAVKKKEREYKKLVSVIDAQIKKQGYTTKDELSKELKMDRSEINYLFSIFKNDLRQLYLYKAPNKKERQQVHLEDNFKKWIIIPAAEA